MTSAEKREAVMAVAEKQVGVRELTGQNDGPEVEAYLASVGLRKGDPWCGAVVFWIGREALGPLNPYPRSGWSPDMVVNGELVSEGATAQPGDTFGIWFPSKGRVAHTGLIGEFGRGSCVTLEGNTSDVAAAGSSQDREGGGFFKKRRLRVSIHSVRDWISR